jgi:hypothetical protein
MQQGSKANHTGKMFEREVQSLLESKQIHTEPPPKYKAAWFGTRLNQTDKWLPELDTQIELKYQAVGGTCDQKPFAELWNASENIPCKHYILVLGGPHWDTPRGNNIYESAKRMAASLDERSVGTLEGAQKLTVAKYPEFKEWINESC